MIIFKAGILKIAGDVELNPGPYEILKSDRGNLNQGNKTRLMFEITVGCLCTCSEISENVCSHIRKRTCWEPTNLDKILIEGDRNSVSMTYQDKFICFSILLI